MGNKKIISNNTLLQSRNNFRTRNKDLLDKLVSDSGMPLAFVAVVKNGAENFCRLELAYYALDKDFIDKKGYVAFCWTKEDLQRMLSMLEIVEDIIDEPKQREQREKNKR